MNWKARGRKRSWPNNNVSRNLPGGTEDKYENPQSGSPVAGSIFEPGISRLRSMSVNHSAVMFGFPVSFRSKVLAVYKMTFLLKTYLYMMCMKQVLKITDLFITNISVPNRIF
jgi:hypothetical protein